MKTTLTTPKLVGIGLVTLILLWHLVVAMTSRISVCGPFRAKPAEPGYVWTDADNADARFFWQTAGVRWLSGLPHSVFKAEAGEREGTWNAMPGYAFVDKSQGLNTLWKASLKHPDFMAWSDDVEGEWIPVTGYKFIYEGDTFVATVWDPNKRYDDVKVISLVAKDNYKPFPGYTFAEPGQSLKVVWTPGIANSDNYRLMAGSAEGSWVVNTSPATSRPRYTRQGNGGRDARLFFGGMATGYFLRRW